MNIVHLMLAGGIGGIQVLTKDISKSSNENNIFYFLFEGGMICDEISEICPVHIANGSHTRFVNEAVKFTEFCKKNDADVIISHFGSPIGRFIAAFAKKALGKKVKMLQYCHSNACDTLYKDKPLKSFFDKAILMDTYKSADKVVAISKSVKQSFINIYGFDPEKIAVVYNGIDVNKFYSNAVSSNDNGTFKLIYVGRVVGAKGISLLIDAVKILSGNIPISLKIVGNDPGDYTEKMKNKAEKLGLSDIIEFTGARTDIPQLLAEADLFVHPATWEEGFGITLAEAMAAYVPCVAFKKGAIPEIIDHEINGFMVDEVSAKAFAKAIEKAYDVFKTESYKQIRLNARKKAETFNIENTVSQLEALYK